MACALPGAKPGHDPDLAGWRLRLTEEERTALDIQTIRAMGMTDAKMAAERKRKAAIRAAR